MKTGRIGYDIAVIFCRVIRHPHFEDLAIIPTFSRLSEFNLITDRTSGFTERSHREQVAVESPHVER